MRPSRYFSSSSCSSELRRRFCDLASRSAVGFGNGDCSSNESGRCQLQDAVVDAMQNSPRLRRLLLRRPLRRSRNPGTTEGGCAPQSPQRALGSTGKRQLCRPAWRAKLAVVARDNQTKNPKKGRRSTGTLRVQKAILRRVILQCPLAIAHCQAVLMAAQQCAHMSTAPCAPTRVSSMKTVPELLDHWP